MDAKDTREAVDATNAIDEEVEEINIQQYYFISFTYKGRDWDGLVGKFNAKYNTQYMPDELHRVYLDFQARA
ncbi:MAG: hypothetical protein M1824_006378 [Vezdaea acicularis]|nr:MAG: hypothetical protein M1824_006378 [Vezdaea acicularis]